MVRWRVFNLDGFLAWDTHRIMARQWREAVEEMKRYFLALFTSSEVGQ
jgi:hypothetical protein